MENNNEILHKEIDLIQACISRMCTCSFYVKGGYISLVTVIITFLIVNKIDMIIVGAMLLIITIICWYLDGFYLKTERLYREKYQWIIENRMHGNMDFLYDLNPHNEKMKIKVEENSKESKIKSREIKCVEILCSKNLLMIYGIVFIAAIVLIIMG